MEAIKVDIKYKDVVCSEIQYQISSKIRHDVYIELTDDIYVCGKIGKDIDLFIRDKK